MEGKPIPGEVLEPPQSDVFLCNDRKPLFPPKGLFSHDQRSLYDQPLQESLPAVRRSGQLPRILGLALSVA